MNINYNNRKFKVISSSENGETSVDTIFHYQQKGAFITATYCGGQIIEGHLIATADESGKLDIRYHQISKTGMLMTGICRSIPEIMPNGKIRLYEAWQWTAGDYSAGCSIIEEI